MDVINEAITLYIIIFLILLFFGEEGFNYMVATSVLFVLISLGFLLLSVAFWLLGI